MLAPSERVAIGKAIEDEIRQRAKERQIALAGTRPSKGDLREDLPEGLTGRASDQVAEIVGWCGKTYQYARNVVDNGIPELQEAMDSNAVAPWSATEIARLPRDEQVKVVKGGPEEIRKKAKELKQSRSKNEDKREKEKPKPNPDALKEGIFSAYVVAVQVEGMIDLIASIVVHAFDPQPGHTAGGRLFDGHLIARRHPSVSRSARPSRPRYRKHHQ